MSNTDYNTEMQDAFNIPLLTSDEEKTLARRIELAKVLESLPPDATTAETTITLLLIIAQLEPAVRQMAVDAEFNPPLSLYEFIRHKPFRGAIDGVVAPIICDRKDPSFPTLNQFSATCDLIYPTAWDIINEIAPDYDASQILRTLSDPDTLMDLLTPLIPRIAAFFRSIERDAEDARDRFFQSNTRLVRQQAAKYTYTDLESDDRFQEGCIGLLTAIEKFNHHQGYKFSTYATWWVRQAVTRAIADQGRTIRVPVHIHDKINRMRSVRERFSQEGIPPTPENLAPEMEITPDAVRALIINERQIPVSLDQPIKTSSMELSEATIMNFIPDPYQDTEHKALERSYTAQINEAIQSTINPREQQVIEMRFGLNGHERMTLDQIGTIMSVTRERIRQIEANALRKLKPALAKHGIASFID